ncbi:unnamed protein product, partial [Phaeothamnion confervicola]
KRVRIDTSIADLRGTAREIRIMRLAGCHPNIIDVHNVCVDEDRDTVYMILPLHDTDLGKIISSPQPLTEAHVLYFMFQILQGLCFLHKHNIIHRDLKPANILVNKDATLCIADFGMARVTRIQSNEPDSGAMSSVIVTRWYRAPELMLVPNGLYDQSVDMWSAGCILGEIL